MVERVARWSNRWRWFCLIVIYIVFVFFCVLLLVFNLIRKNLWWHLSQHHLFAPRYGQGSVSQFFWIGDSHTLLLPECGAFIGNSVNLAFARQKLSNLCNMKLTHVNLSYYWENVAVREKTSRVCIYIFKSKQLICCCLWSRWTGDLR